MYSEKATDSEEIKNVINNLCKDTVLELALNFGSDYRQKAFETIENAHKFIIKLKETNEAVGLFGLIPITEHSAGIFLLTTDNLHKGNIVTFLKQARKQVNEWSNDYKLIMDYCYKQNKTIQKWLTLLGFKPSEHQDIDFQIYYKGDISLYE